MNQIFTGGHSIMVRGDNLIIDGKIVNVRLKRSLFGGCGSVSVVSNGSVIQNGGDVIVSGSAKVKIGRNKIEISGKKIIVNGKEVTFGEPKQDSKQSLDDQLNKNAHKYKISTEEDDKIEIDGEICHRIIALKDIVDKKGEILVRKGQKGGYVVDRSNLSEDGTCWVYDDAVARQNSRVIQDAKLRDLAEAYGSSTIGGNSQAYERAKVHGNVTMGGNSRAYGKSELHGNLSLGGNSQILDKADVHGNVSIGGTVVVMGNAEVHGNVSLGGDVMIAGDAVLDGNIVLSGHERIIDNSQLKSYYKEQDRNISINGTGNIVGNDSVINLSATVIRGKILSNIFEQDEDDENKK